RSQDRQEAGRAGLADRAGACSGGGEVMSAPMIARTLLLGASLSLAITAAAHAAAAPAPAAGGASSLDQLLEQTRTQRAREAQTNAAREQQFAADRNRQAELFAAAQREK